MANSEHTTTTPGRTAWDVTLKLETIVMDANLFAEALFLMVDGPNLVEPKIFWWISNQIEALANRIEQQRVDLSELIKASRATPIPQAAE